MNHHPRTTHLLPDLVTDELLRGSLALSARPDSPVQPAPGRRASPRLAALRAAPRRAASRAVVSGRPAPADVCVGTRITSA